MAMNSGFLRMMSFRSLLGDPHEWDPQLSSFPIEIRTLHSQSLGGGRHTPVVMLKHRGDVVALEPLPRLAQVARRHERRVSAVQLQDREDVLDLNELFPATGDDPFDCRAQLF